MLGQAHTAWTPPGGLACPTWKAVATLGLRSPGIPRPQHMGDSESPTPESVWKQGASPVQHCRMGSPLLVSWVGVGWGVPGMVSALQSLTLMPSANPALIEMVSESQMASPTLHAQRADPNRHSA